MRQIINPNDFLVLIVDDVPSNLKVLRGILEPIGYDLTFATSGKQTLERVNRVKPDLILLDLMMPDMDGFEVCRALYDDYGFQDIPIIFLTASLEEKHLVNAFEQGAVDYITKPFNKPELLARIKTHLELKHYSDRLQQQVKQEKLMTQLTKNILSYSDLNNILEHTVTGICSLLQADRAIIGRCYQENQAEIVAEYIAGDCPSLLGQHITDLNSIKLDKNGDRTEQISIINNSDSQVNLLTHKLNLINNHQVKSEVIIPLLQQQTLWGILIVNYCQSSHSWRQDEIGLLSQLISQTEIAIQQSELYEQLRLANQELDRLAHIDSLTQIANRRQFDLSIDREWLRLRREKLPLSLIICDVDQFKQYNDFYGHLEGDICLHRVAQAMAKTLQRPADLVARIGGEEFAILLPNTDLNGATCIAKQIQQAIIQLQIPHLRSNVYEYVTLSMGVSSMIPVGDTSFSQLIDAADQALFTAKTKGRNKFVVQEISCSASDSADS